MEPWKLDLSTAELRTALNTFVDHLEATKGLTVQLAEDYFWSVETPDHFDVEVPPEVSIGQLSWSWDNLARERQGDREITVDYAAEWLAEVLTGIGQSQLEG